MEYYDKFRHTLGRKYHISLMIRIDIFYTALHLATQTVAPNLTGFQGIKHCIKYLTSQPHKPIFYPSNYHDGSNGTILTWNGNQIEDYKTHNCLECHQYADHDIILNIRRSVSSIIHTLLGVDFYCKV